MEIGEGISFSAPIYEGYAIPHNINRINLAGLDIIKHMSKLLNQKSNTTKFNGTIADQEIMRLIVHQNQESFTMPDGSILKV